MKRILVGLIALGLAMGLMFGCVLNPGDTVEITTENGVVAESGQLSADVVVTQTDANGRVKSTFTFKTDGTWEYMSYTFEDYDENGVDVGNDGTAGTGTMIQTGGFKGTYSYDVATKKLTLNWFGNIYYELPTGDAGYAWSGDYGSTLTDPAGTYAINTEPNDGSVLDGVAGEQPFSNGVTVVLSTVETVWWDYTDLEVAAIDSTTGNPVDAWTFVQSTDYLYKIFAGGTYYTMTTTYFSGTYDNYKTTSSYETSAVAIDNAAQTLTWTLEEYSIDDAGTTTADSGEKAVYKWILPKIMVDDPYSDDPDDMIWTSTENDVTAGDGENYRITLEWESQDDPAPTISGSTITYTLGDGDFGVANDGSWEIENSGPTGYTDSGATQGGTFTFSSNNAGWVTW